MFRSKSAVLRELHDLRIADLKDSHQRELAALMKLVDSLAEQIEYLRAQMGRPNFSRMASVNPSDQPVAVEGAPAYLSEEEEDLMALREFGHIDDGEVARIREELLAHGVDVPHIQPN